MFAAFLDARELHSLGASSLAPELKLLQKVQQGLFAFARLCSVYSMNDCFNSLCITLAKSLTAFLADAFNDRDGFTPAASFGRDRRAQTVAVTLFRLVQEYGDVHLLEGWANVLHCILWLRQMDVLPASLLEMEDFRDAAGGPLDSLRRDKKSAGQQPAASSSQPEGYGSRLSYLVSFFLSEDDGPRLSSPASAAVDAQWAQEARAVIASCNIDGIFSASKYFRPASLTCLLRALLQVSASATHPASSSILIFSPHVLNEEAAVFCLERFSDVIEKNQTRLSDAQLKLWPTLYEHLFSAITHAPPEPTFYIERLVVNILRFSVRLLHTSDPAVTSHCIQLLSVLLALSPPTLLKLGSRIVAGLHIFLQTQGDAVKERKSWEIIGRLLLTFRAEKRGGVAASAWAAFILCIDNWTSVDTFPLFLHFLYQFADQTDSRTAAEAKGVVTPAMVLDCAIRLHNRIGSAAMEAELTALPEGSAREKARVDLWLSSVQQICISCRDRSAARPRSRSSHAAPNLSAHPSSGLFVLF